MANKISPFIPSITAYQGILICGAISTSLYVGALLFQYVGGLTPCSLCLWQRWPHIIIMLLAALSLVTHTPRLILTIISIIAFVSMVLGGYHAGVEWGIWSGPDGCSADFNSGGDLTSLTNSLLATSAIKCDEIVWSFLGLSMSGWNSLFSLDMCLIAIISLKR